MKLVEAALFCTLASEAGQLSVCSSVAFWLVSAVDFPVWAGDTDSVRSPGHESTTGRGWRMVLVQRSRQPSHQISCLTDSRSGEENWHIKMTDSSWPTWNLSFWMDSSQRRTMCTGCCWLDVGNLLCLNVLVSVQDYFPLLSSRPHPARPGCTPPSPEFCCICSRSLTRLAFLTSISPICSSKSLTFALIQSIKWYIFLVHLNCYNKMLPIVWLINYSSYLSLFWMMTLWDEGAASMAEFLQGPILRCRQQSSHWVISWWKGWGSTLGPLLSGFQSQ